MRKTVTTYVCDGCGKKQREQKDLQTFTLVRNVRYHGWDFGDDAWKDLCVACEVRLIETVEPFLGAGVLKLLRDHEEKPRAKPKGRARR